MTLARSAIFFAAVITAFLISPWLFAGLDAYLDWQYCVTHDQPAYDVDDLDYFIYQERCTP